MEIRWQGRIVGEFLGYALGRVFEISGHGKWKQENHTDEPCWRQDPGAKLYWDQSLGVWWLDVEGTSASVIVSQGEARRTVGAF